MTKESLETWNRFLSQPSENDSTLQKFPYRERSQNILRKLTSQWLQIIGALSVPVVAIICGLIAFYALNVGTGNASIVSATVFAGLAPGWVGWLRNRGSKS